MVEHASNALSRDHSGSTYELYLFKEDLTEERNNCVLVFQAAGHMGMVLIFLASGGGAA
jgi:hypothetical protein